MADRYFYWRGGAAGADGGRCGRGPRARCSTARRQPAGRSAVPGNYSLEITPLSSGGQTVMAAEPRRRAQRREKESLWPCVCWCAGHVNTACCGGGGGGRPPLPRHCGLSVTGASAGDAEVCGVAVVSREPPARPTTRTANNPPFLPVRPRAELPLCLRLAHSDRLSTGGWSSPTAGES